MNSKVLENLKCFFQCKSSKLWRCEDSTLYKRRTWVFNALILLLAFSICATFVRMFTNKALGYKWRFQLWSLLRKRINLTGVAVFNLLQGKPLTRPWILTTSGVFFSTTRKRKKNEKRRKNYEWQCRTYTIIVYEYIYSWSVHEYKYFSKITLAINCFSDCVHCFYDDLLVVGIG